jgi:hypothetical protein
VAIVDRAGELHRARRERLQLQGRLRWQRQHVQVRLSAKRSGVLRPPLIGLAAAVGEHHDPSRAAAGLAHVALVRQADIEPKIDRAGGIAAPEIGFAFGR